MGSNGCPRCDAKFELSTPAARERARLALEHLAKAREHLDAAEEGLCSVAGAEDALFGVSTAADCIRHARQLVKLGVEYEGWKMKSETQP